MGHARSGLAALLGVPAFLYAALHRITKEEWVAEPEERERWAADIDAYFIKKMAKIIINLRHPQPACLKKPHCYSLRYPENRVYRNNKRIKTQDSSKIARFARSINRIVLSQRGGPLHLVSELYGRKGNPK